jgi:hypothetical protein
MYCRNNPSLSFSVIEFITEVKRVVFLQVVKVKLQVCDNFINMTSPTAFASLNFE